LASEPAADSVAGVALAGASIVPVSSSFFPMCGLSDAAFAIRRYVCAALAAPVSGALAVLGEPEGSAGAGAASVSRNFCVAEASPAVPAVPAVAVVPVVPVVPVVVVAAPLVVVLAELAGASFRHPVTVILLSALEVLVCGAEVVCAVMATVANPTIAVNTPVQIPFIILPPECLQPATVRPDSDQVGVMSIATCSSRARVPHTPEHAATKAQ
jgi:hypothetical protein